VKIRDLTSDPYTRHPEFLREQKLISFLGLPLVAKGETLGVWVLLTKEEHDYTDEEVELFSTLAGHTAMAIYNATLHEQVKRQAAQLEKAYKLQTDFTAIIAHDLRSPLMNILSVAGLMVDGLLGPVNDEQKKWLGKIEDNSNTLVELISDFLDLAKLETGHIELVKSTVSLKPLVETLVENYLPRCEQKKIALYCHIDPALKPIHADRRRLNQVLSNLLSNAVKFTPAGGTIEVGARQTDKETTVWVKDSGVGISPAELATLFEKYRQSTSGKDSSQIGTGLGLVICKMIVEAHGGKIHTESAEGIGSTFSFSLPRTT
jgi:signal transduction histidine kinase